jgi:hypothetical protein
VFFNWFFWSLSLFVISTAESLGVPKHWNIFFICSTIKINQSNQKSAQLKSSQEKTMIFVEKITKRHLESLCHFERLPLTKTDGISGILGQHFAVKRL